MFFEKFNELAKKENSSVNAVAKSLNLSSGSVTAWKGGTEPSLSAVSKIADYFNVSTDYLLGREADTVSDRQLKFALTGDDSMSDEVLDDIKAFAKMHADRKRKRT
jgi:transcriptional regulator with XRE-family HTH domain